MLNLCLGLFLFMATTAYGPIFRCESADGTEFRDRPCENSIVVAQGTVNTVRMAPLHDSERARLEALALRVRQSIEADRQRQSRARRAAAQTREVSEAECAAAREQMRLIAVKRRKGYSLAESSRLAKETAAIKERIDAHC